MGVLLRSFLLLFDQVMKEISRNTLGSIVFRHKLYTNKEQQKEPNPTSNKANEWESGKDSASFCYSKQVS